MTPDAKRKLTTILAADAVGFSKLMSENEEKTLAILQGYRDLAYTFISKHGGRVFSTAGDAYLAEFGSAVEAVRCAISIQEDISVRNAELPENEQMWFRIGINVGDVIIENDNLFGDGVNIAARLEGLAESGGICISGSTFEQVKNKLSVAFDDIGAQSVKNIPHPVAAFRIVAGQAVVKKGGERFDHKKRASPGAISRRLAFGIGGVAIVAGIAVYNLVPNGSNERNPFDGKWLVEVDQIEGCLSNDSRSFAVFVENGVIDQPKMKIPKRGTISKEGDFEIISTDQAGFTTATQKGTIGNDEGKGVFQGRKPGCKGAVTITRMDN